MKFPTDNLFKLMRNDNYSWWCEFLSGSRANLVFIASLDVLDDSSEIEQVRLALEDNLTAEQISTFVSENFNRDQMEQIRLGYKNGLTQEQVKLYADKSFNLFQMQEIRFGLQHGLPEEQVKTYASPTYGWSDMSKKRTEREKNMQIENLSYIFKMRSNANE